MCECRRLFANRLQDGISLDGLQWSLGPGQAQGLTTKGAAWAGASFWRYRSTAPNGAKGSQAAAHAPKKAIRK